MRAEAAAHATTAPDPVFSCGGSETGSTYDPVGPRAARAVKLVRNGSVNQATERIGYSGKIARTNRSGSRSIFRISKTPVPRAIDHRSAEQPPGRGAGAPAIGGAGQGRRGRWRAAPRTPAYGRTAHLTLNRQHKHMLHTVPHRPPCMQAPWSRLFDPPPPRKGLCRLCHTYLLFKPFSVRGMP